MPEPAIYSQKSTVVKGLISVILVISGWLCSITAYGQENRPNILIILSDDHSQSAISAYGSNIIKTPNIDRVAQNGMRFTNAFVISSICAPSRAALLAGTYSAHNGVRRIGDTFDGDQATFVKLLRKNGYETSLIGKWHLLSEPTGFDYYNVLVNQGKYFDSPMLEKGQEWDGNKGAVIQKGYVTDVITDQSINWLKERKTNSPFCLLVHHKAPHSPQAYPAKYDSLFTQDLPLPASFDDAFEGKNYYISNNKIPYSKLTSVSTGDASNRKDPPEEILKGTREYKEWAYQSLFKGYYRLVTSLDENVGRLLDYMKTSGLNKNTVIVYMSDNGFFLGDHGLYNKMWMYDESMRIPVLISYPGRIIKGTINDDLVSELDIAPTLLEFAGVSIPEHFQGKSLVPILQGKRVKEWRKEIFYHYYDAFDVPDHFGIRTKEYKLIHFPLLPNHSESTVYELYNLKTDPDEMINLINVPEYARIAESLKKNLNVKKEQFEK